MWMWLFLYSADCAIVAENQTFAFTASTRGFLRSDKPIGTAQIKLDKLETQSEIREIVEVNGSHSLTHPLTPLLSHTCFPAAAAL